MATSISVEGLHHGGMPIPSASRRGPLVASGGIAGMDPSTGTVPDDLERQLELVFANMRAIVEAAGGTVDDIVKVTVHVGDRAVRPLVNDRWIVMFPDEAHRPARHTVARELAGSMLVQLDFIAYVEAS